MLDGKEKRIFSGWMFADSPGLNAVEHPVFDVWLTDCEPSARHRPAPASGRRDHRELASPTPSPPTPTSPAAGVCRGTHLAAWRLIFWWSWAWSMVGALRPTLSASARAPLHQPQQQDD